MFSCLVANRRRGDEVEIWAKHICTFYKWMISFKKNIIVYVCDCIFHLQTLILLQEVRIICFVRLKACPEVDKDKSV